MVLGLLFELLGSAETLDHDVNETLIRLMMDED